MCGRFSFSATKEKIKRQFGINLKEDLPKSYNIAPTQESPVLLQTEKGMSLEFCRWGLIPSWANSTSVGNNLINARSEDIAVRPSFRIPIRYQRCLVLADSFYEWDRSAIKQAFRISLPNANLLAMAGIWDIWEDSITHKKYFTFAIITTKANKELEYVHDRMPVMIQDPKSIELWLDKNTPLNEVLSLQKPLADMSLRVDPISDAINNPQNNFPELHTPIIMPPRLF